MLASSRQFSALRAAAPIDCDLHPAPPTMAQLLPFLEPHWRDTITARGIDGLDLCAYPPGAPISARPDWRGADGPPALNAETLARQALDPFATTVGILNVPARRAERMHSGGHGRGALPAP